MEKKYTLADIIWLAQTTRKRETIEKVLCEAVGVSYTDKNNVDKIMNTVVTIKN